MCPECGAPWRRVVDREPISTPTYSEPRGYTVGGGARDTITRLGDGLRVTTGWEPTCPCGTMYGGVLTSPAPLPATVLDPFLGSGTTALVARKHGRRAIGIELSPAYCEMAARRTRQLSLLA